MRTECLDTKFYLHASDSVFMCANDVKMSSVYIFFDWLFVFKCAKSNVLKLFLYLPNQFINVESYPVTKEIGL